MTTLPPAPLGLTYSASPDSVRVELSGDLDHRHADLLVAAVDEVLTEHPGLRDLRLDCAGLTAVDSSGLSALLMVRRRTGKAGAALHLDGRTAQLARLLEVTGTLEYLTEPTPGTGAQPLRRSGVDAVRGAPEKDHPGLAEPRT
ncbi:STAS domain-containing protein [Streptomyces sp. NPDC048387]|uniref:STAS domain-containing protein n=1 Tax=Streptomyces sp. NPDC048387 TaxID=3365542 RepID=UPI00371D35B4